MKFLLLNAEVYFYDILQEAKAVILAGGTLEPVISEYFIEMLILISSEIRDSKPIVGKSATTKNSIIFMWTHHTQRQLTPRYSQEVNYNHNIALINSKVDPLDNCLISLMRIE